MALPRYKSFLGIAKNGQTATVTAASGNGTTITYTATNSFSAGQIVTITGLTTTTGVSLNLANATIATASGSNFTVTSTLVGTATATQVGTASLQGANSVTTATDYIPVKEIAPFDNVKYLDDNSWRGSMVETYGTVQGNIHAEFQFGGDVYPDTIGYAVAGVLGDYVKSGASAPYVHTMAVLNSNNGQATSYTFTDFNSLNARQFAGCQFGGLDVKFNAEGLLEYTATAQGFKSVITTTPSPSFSSVTNVPAWTGVTTIGGTVTAKLAEGNINITRPLSAIFTVDGNQAPYQIFQGAVSVDGSLKLIFEDDSDLNNYLSNTQPSLDITFSQGTGATATSIKFTMSKCAFQVAKIDRSKDYVELDVTYKAIANGTDVGASAGYSPIKVVLNNAKATAVYA
jgi:hypothetical protein